MAFLAARETSGVIPTQTVPFDWSMVRAIVNRHIIHEKSVLESSPVHYVHVYMLCIVIIAVGNNGEAVMTFLILEAIRMCYVHDLVQSPLYHFSTIANSITAT